MDANARFWDGIAESYAKKPFPKPETTKRKVQATLDLLRPEHRLLDIGCATGTLPLEFAPHVAEVVGLDVSPAMIAIAQRKVEAADASNIRLVAEPTGSLSAFEAASFDCVTLYNVLHLVAEPAVLLAEIFRVLRPGGAFVSSTVCVGGRWFPPYALILPVLRWIGKAPLVTPLTAAEVRELISAAGFVDIVAPDVGDTGLALFLTARKPG